jgi:hypothetical protein
MSLLIVSNVQTIIDERGRERVRDFFEVLGRGTAPLGPLLGQLSGLSRGLDFHPRHVSFRGKHLAEL